MLALPVLVDADSPNLTWGYPDAVYIVVATAGGATLCIAIVRGFGAAGMRRRIAEGRIA